MPLFKTNSSKKEETHLDTLQELRQFQIKNPIPINESKIINDMIILSDKQIDKYKGLYNDDVEVYSNIFKFVNNGFNAKIDVSKDTLVLYTVPYDKGWKAFVNKKEVKIEKVDNGLMAVKINKGINNIKFIYYPPGLKLGLILSIVSYISLLVYIIFNKHYSK